MSPARVQRRRTKGWRMPANTVSVCRPGRWGNIFEIGSTGWIPVDSSGKWSKEPHEPLTREQAVQCFRYTAEFTAREFPGFYEPLRGKNLACWCPVDLPCHADVLLVLANDSEDWREGNRVRFWRGIRHPEVEPESGSVIGDGPVLFGGTVCIRVQRDVGGTDVIQLSHIELANTD